MTVDLTPLVLLGSAIILVASWVLARILNRIIRLAFVRAGVAQSRIRNVNQVLTGLSLALGFAVVASYTGLTSEFTVLTISGIAGLAVTLSLQLTFQNIISGVLLVIDNALKVDDVVQIGGIMGKVVRVGFRNTWIQQNDGTIAIVGNSTLSSGPLINYSASQRLLKRLDTT